MQEQLLVRHCAPTLAGMKTGSMFTCPFADAEDEKKWIRGWNAQLRKKGLRILPLRSEGQRTLIYVYRPGQLRRDLQHPLADQLLRENGYPCGKPEQCIVCLTARLAESETFPHEIGLFLGYPPEDVHGFICNDAMHCKCVGCWKVYGDAERAQALFRKYQKCKRVYHRHFQMGSTVDRLTVSA